MLLSLRKNGLTSLNKEVRVFKGRNWKGFVQVKRGLVLVTGYSVPLMGLFHCWSSLLGPGFYLQRSRRALADLSESAGSGPIPKRQI